MNEDVRAREVRLINHDGEQLGIMSSRDALRIAQEKGMDLVEISPAAKPPVCRLMDYGKYRYEQSKRERDARKRQKVTSIKEIKLRVSIEDHDFQVKAKNAQRFLEDGDKIKVTIMFRGREITHSVLGQDLCQRLAKQLSHISNIEKPPKVEGRNMIMILTPKQES